MIPLFDQRLIRVAIVVGSIVSLSGCYYTQAVRGQLDVMHKREPIDQVIAASDTPSDLVERLQLVRDARQFSIDELLLPDNDSYRSYADIERDYVVWNVFAAPEFSLEPKHWCFPVAGCVNYRGYFSEAAARREAAKLKDKGHDVAVGGVAAYSTLGKFSDPVLNTMMRWEDVDLIAVLFHELAHQKLYVKGDTGFNESFASAVEEIGVERWLNSRRIEDEFEAYRERRELRQQLMNLVALARTELEEIYSSSIGSDAMRSRKQARLKRLSDDLNRELDVSGRERPEWLSDGLNNARLASMTLYDARLPEFRKLLADCNDDLDCFYGAAKKLSEKP
ncbi:MAG: aminopeptidase [Gammaproteobacteria bacterium]|jgi:predicted aminopeptidase|nr:aminopeptidase [Gammaproteobacteria bacterium]MDH3749987.1 aminopeptidase [Gammaproteobacteria bacterium]